MLHVSSALFATAVVHAYLKKHLFYAGLLVFLTVTSIAWHASPKLEPQFMIIFWADQIAIWSVLLMSVFYTGQMSSPLFSTLLVLLGLMAAGLSVYLTVFCDWSNSYPAEHATLHGIAVLAFHCIIAGLPCWH
jgi:hypothetical protein